MRFKSLPAPRVKNYPARNANRRIIPTEKLPGFYKAVNNLRSDAARDYFLFILLTGQYRRDAIALKWKHVDLEHGTIQGAEGTIPICSQVVQMLKERYGNRKGAYVFPGRNRDQALRKAGCSFDIVAREIGYGFSIDDVRRTHRKASRQLGCDHLILKTLPLEERLQKLEEIAMHLLKLINRTIVPRKKRCGSEDIEEFEEMYF